MKQKGFTLVELLAALAIGSVILTVALLSLQQVVFGTDRTISQVVALTDVAQAAHRIKQDIFMTQSANLTDGSLIPQSSVNLTWIDSTSNNTAHSSSYVLSGTMLQRTYGGKVSIVGRNITYLGFTRNGRVINFIITATGPGVKQKMETLKFSGYMRPEATQ